jgi:ferredoxin
MTARVDLSLLPEIKRYGALNPEACFNCGNCTAICSLADGDHPFPRNGIRLLQLGLRDKLRRSTDPWLCYYCGECSETCPRGAEPAETMMALRRWLTAQYDRSGHAARMYTSERTTWGAILRVALSTLGLFVLYHLLTGFTHINTQRVALNDFAPARLVWAFVLLHFGWLGLRLLRNAREMIRLVIGPETTRSLLPPGSYLAELKQFVLHYFTQQRWRECSQLDRGRWLKHILLVSGYLTMLLLVVGLLWWFQTDAIYPVYHPQRWLGYYATVVLLYTSSEALIGRWRRDEQLHRFSHPTDWLFPSFILTGTLTGILVHIFRYLGWPWPTYGMYLVHVMAMVAMLDTEVGIGKWTHMIYRPLAVSLEAIKRRIRQPSLAPDLAPSGAD